MNFVLDFYSLVCQKRNAKLKISSVVTKPGT